MSIPWPDVPASLFGSDDRAPLFNVSLVQPISPARDVRAYKEGYRRAAVALAKEVERGVSPDYLVWPIAWCWRHFLELALKDIIARGTTLHDEYATRSWPSDVGHSLGRAWERSLPYIVEHGAPDAPEVGNVTLIVQEFERLDPRGVGFRYHLARDGTSPSLEQHEQWINVHRMDETMQRVANFLEAVALCQDLALEELVDQRAREIERIDE